MERRKNFRNFIRRIRLYFREIDVWLFAAVAAISVLSLINLYGITGSYYGLVQKQAALIAAGFLVMIACSFFNYRYLKNYSLPVMIVYVAVLALLLVTLAFRPIRGIHAWIVVGGFTFEPSELAKLALIILLAKYFSQRHIHINQFRHIVASFTYMALPAVIVLTQPDLGSAAILGLIWLGIILAAGINKRHLFILIIAAAFSGYLGFVFGLKPYQKDRITSFINPYKDPSGIGYNIIQSKIAIGSGGWLGNGLGNGSQATLGFLPEAYNDFVFAAFAEQFGFAGTAALFALLLLIIWRITKIGESTSGNFGKLFALGLLIFIFSHIIVSAAVNIGLMPITGIPFSFLSYGGSHLISIMIGIGIVQSIRRYS